jgi:hypothetical protein
MVAILARHEFDCAARRRPLFEDARFRMKLVLTKRPRWVDGPQRASPRHNFAWFLWDHQHRGAPADDPLSADPISGRHAATIAV